MEPLSTSPLPAVARLRGMSTLETNPSAGAITVVVPFRTTVWPQAAAASLAALTGSLVISSISFEAGTKAPTSRPTRRGTMCFWINGIAVAAANGGSRPPEPEYWVPAQSPSAGAWGGALALAFVCTGLAYILFFRLIAHTGATNAMTVTFLIPVFAMLWGTLALGERPEPDMLLGAAVILFGTALAVGVLRWPKRSG